MLRTYITYLKDNPKGYWFKARLFGWGWTPAKWQGWVVVIVACAVAFLGFYVGDVDDAPGAALLGILLAIGIICVFGYWKGEKPRWQWGAPKEKK